MDWLFGWTCDHSHCGADSGNFRVNDIDFADDAVTMVDPLDFFRLALETALGVEAVGLKNLVD